MNRLIATGFSLVLAFTCAAQGDPLYKSYKWDDKPVVEKIKSEWQEFPAVHVLHNRIQEIRLDFNSVKAYYTEHKIIHINSAAGIERFNKVYIPVKDDKAIISLNVRAIDPNGGITILNRQNLKELSNVEGYGNFKIFAVEGLTVGGEMEYTYTMEVNPSQYGRYKIQSEIPVMKAAIALVCPRDFVFSGKSYNGLPQPNSEIIGEGRKKVELIAKDVPALLEEQYSAHDANEMKMDYKLEATRSQRLTWDVLCDRVLKSNYEANAGGKMRKLLKPLALENMSEIQKVQAVEKFIKMNFTIKKGGGDDYEDTKTVIETHVANERGMLKLFMSCWEELGLRPMLVLCSDRFKARIDPDFTSMADVTDVLFFFPSLNMFLDPTTAHLRLGAAPDNIASSTGIFAAFTFLENQIKYLHYEVRTIPALNYLHNNLGVKAVVRFKGKLDQPEIFQENFWQGYRAASYRGFYYYTPEDGKDKFIKAVTMSGIDNANFSSRELEGEDVNLSFDADSYFKIKTAYNAPSLVEQSGEDYLFSVGKLIGRQSELYQESKRMMDVEFLSIANYNHELVVEIPDGYSCTGLEAIKINNVVNNGKEDVMYFHSDYQTDGKKITIKINEVYKVLQLPKSDYEAFRKVVNSAADFNKVVLVLHPVNK